MPRTLGIGVYDGGQLVPMVRHSFLHTIRKSAPQVLEELRDETLKLFLVAKHESAANAPRRTKPQVEPLRKKLINGTIQSSEISLVRQDFEAGEFNLDKELSAFLQSLLDWSKRWNLDADWCLFRAFKTLHSWSRHQAYVEDLQWSTLLTGVDNPEGEPLPPEDFPAWNVFEDSRRAYKEMIKDNARNHLINHPTLSKIKKDHREGFVRLLEPIVKGYQDKVSNFYDGLGYKSINRQELIKHIDWTVDFQVRHIEFSAIADASNVAQQAVSKAVKSILQLMDLKPRKGAPAGRPQGSKDTNKGRHIVRRSTSR